MDILLAHMCPAKISGLPILFLTLFDQVMVCSVAHQFGIILDIHFLHQPCLVGADGLTADKKRIGSFVDGFSLRD